MQTFDLSQGPRYTEPIDDAFGDNELENIYNMTAGRWEDYVNSTVDGSVSSRSIDSFSFNLEEAGYNW